MTNHVSHIGHMMSCANTGLLCGITGGVKVWVLALNLVLLIPDFFVDDSGITTSDWCSMLVLISKSIRVACVCDVNASLVKVVVSCSSTVFFIEGRDISIC